MLSEIDNLSGHLLGNVDSLMERPSAAARSLKDRTASGNTPGRGAILDLLQNPEEKASLSHLTAVMSLLEGPRQRGDGCRGRQHRSFREDHPAALQRPWQGPRRHREVHPQPAGPGCQDAPVQRRGQVRPRRGGRCRDGRLQPGLGRRRRTSPPSRKSTTPRSGSTGWGSSSVQDVSGRRSRLRGPHRAESRSKADDGGPAGWRRSLAPRGKCCRTPWPRQATRHRCWWPAAAGPIRWRWLPWLPTSPAVATLTGIRWPWVRWWWTTSCSRDPRTWPPAPPRRSRSWVSPRWRCARWTLPPPGWDRKRRPGTPGTRRWTRPRRNGAPMPILLGHTLDDQAEQVLLGLARGSGTRSLAGMRPARGMLLRPFLGLRRADTLEICRRRGTASPGTIPATRTPPLPAPGPGWKCCRCWRKSSGPASRNPWPGPPPSCSWTRTTWRTWPNARLPRWRSGPAGTSACRRRPWADCRRPSGSG